MIKRIVCTALLVASSGVHAADWEREFFSPMTNELPEARGVVVDEIGHVHLQAFNKQPWSTDHELVHQYTIDAQGQIPWIWGLSSVSRKSDCGVFAREGQRLDCLVSDNGQGEEARLEMRSAYGSNIVWQTPLPAGFTLLDAGIPMADEALVIGTTAGPTGTELTVLQGNGGPLQVVSSVPACAQPGQTLTASAFRIPRYPFLPIRAVKACSGAGETTVSVESFDRWSGQWTQLAEQSAPPFITYTHVAINQNGKAFVLADHGNGFRELLSSGVYGDAWMSMTFPGNTPVEGFVVNDRAVVIVAANPDPNVVGPENVLWLDLQAGFWPMFVPTPSLATFDAQSYTLSSEGKLVIAGRDTTQPILSEQIWQVGQDGQRQVITALPLTPNETTIGTPQLVATPGNGLIVARTLSRDTGWGNPLIGVRVNHYDLLP